MTPGAMRAAAAAGVPASVSKPIRRAFDALVERENADRVRAYNVDRIAAALGIQIAGPSAPGEWYARIHGYADAAAGHTPAEAIGNLLRAVVIDDPGILQAALTT